MHYFRKKKKGFSFAAVHLKNVQIKFLFPVLADSIQNNYYLWSVNDEFWYRIHLQMAVMNVLSPSGLGPTISQFRDGC